MSKRLALPALLSGVLFLANGTYAATVTTSFEFSANGVFTVGTAPISATFSGGSAQTVGNLSLYHSGLFSWHVPAGGLASVSFETPASEVDFWYRDAPGASASTISVYDIDNALIRSFTGSQSFTNIVVNRSGGATLIRRIDFVSAGGADSVADTFSFIADTPSVFDPADPLATVIQPGAVEVELAQLVTGLVAPVTGALAPGDNDNVYIVDQVGKIYALDTSSQDLTEVADLSSKTVAPGAFGPGTFDERGLLGLAFHPGFATNGRVYTYTSEPATGGGTDFPTAPPVVPNHRSVITEYTLNNPSARPLNFSQSTQRVLLRIDQPQFNHNGGSLFFDANNWLYISLGDGGGADDEGGGHSSLGNGRDPATVLGSILRIDPLGNNSTNGQYGIPAGNPFTASANTLDEIYAYGFRNPYRASIDRSTGAIWVADVGQHAIEEINLLAAGGNYGWNYKEGTFFFSGNGAGVGGTISDVDPGVPVGLIDPVAQYDHDDGIAVVGGYVYRGTAIADLVGKYVFGDYGSFNAGEGRLLYLDTGNAIKGFRTGGSMTLPAAVLGFAQDIDGEIYVLTNETGIPSGTTGTIWKLTAPASSVAPVNTGGGGGGGGGTGWLCLLIVFTAASIGRRFGLYSRARLQ